MDLFQRIKKAVQRTALATVTALSLAGTSSAQEPTLDYIISERPISLVFENPLESFDANAHAWYTGTQLTGKLNDSIEDEFDHPAIKSAQVLGTSYIHLGLAYYSHELAHNMRSFDKGHNALDISFKKFRRGFPKVVGNVHESSELTVDGTIFNAVSGVNQVEYNSSVLWRKGLSQWDEGVAFAFAKLAKTSYMLTKWQPQVSGEMVHDIYSYVKLMEDKATTYSVNQIHTPHSYTIPGDDTIYTYYTVHNQTVPHLNHKKTIKRKELLYRSLAADITSLDLWGALAQPLAYVGDLDVPQPTFTDHKIHAPLVNHYLTSEGDFFHILARADEPRVELSLATSFGLSPFDDVRVGGSYSLPRFGTSVVIDVEPFAYFTLGSNGQSIGARISAEHSAIRLWAEPRYNHNDPIENLMKGERDGVSLRGGIEFRF